MPISKPPNPSTLSAVRVDAAMSSAGVRSRGRSTSSYTVCPIVASKLGLPPSSDIVVALAALVRCPGDASRRNNCGNFLPRLFNQS